VLSDSCVREHGARGERAVSLPVTKVTLTSLMNDSGVKSDGARIRREVHATDVKGEDE
jgi:hypothetical protein